MADGVWLQSVQLVQLPIVRRVPDEVKHVLHSRGGIFLRLVGEGRRLGEGIVCLADQAGVAEGFAAQVGGETGGEVLEFAERGTDVDACVGGGCAGCGGDASRVVVEDDGEDGLRAAGVLDCLGGEEEVVLIDRFGVVYSVL